jgi:hypothetical protein
MNKYWFQLIVNLALIAAVVYFVMNEHYWFALLLFFGIRVISEDKKGDKNEV